MEWGIKLCDPNGLMSYSIWLGFMAGVAHSSKRFFGQYTNNNRTEYA
tara:strand:+ start:311 stop:451 length:141 start_codon:yes stop_codon:yes gene_type:complete